MINTGSDDLNKFLGKYGDNITCVYGEAGTGKTTLCLLAAIEQAGSSKKVLFLDAEKNFSTERFEQLLQGRDKKCIEEILLLKIKNFNLQHTQIKNLENIKNVSLIIVDSITHYYRRLYRREPEVARAMLSKQLSVLNTISEKGIPIIITSQVYSDMKNEVVSLGRTLFDRLSERIIRLEKKPRKIIVEKPARKEAYFEIVNEGIKIQ